MCHTCVHRAIFEDHSYVKRLDRINQTTPLKTKSQSNSDFASIDLATMFLYAFSPTAHPVQSTLRERSEALRGNESSSIHELNCNSQSHHLVAEDVNLANRADQ